MQNARRGVGGNKLATIEGVMKSTTPLAGESFVVLQGGINDIITAATDPNATMRSAMQGMVDEAELLGLNYLIVNIAPFKSHADWNTNRQSFTESYNSWLVSAFGAAAIVDMYSVVEDPSTPDTLLPAYDNGDGLHLNSTGSFAVTNAMSVKMTWVDPLPVWDVGADWDISGGTANSVTTTNKGITNVGVCVGGAIHKSRFTVLNYVSGSARIRAGIYGPTHTSDGTYEYVHEVNALTSAVVVAGNFSAGFHGSVDNVSVKRLIEVA